MPTPKHGVIYILTNPSFPEYEKIGFDHSVQGPLWFSYEGEQLAARRERLEQASSTKRKA